MLDVISRPDPKIGPNPLDCALIGGAQLIWLVGPRRPRYIETGRGSGLVIPSLPLPQTLSHILIQSREARGRRDVPPAPPRRSPPPLPSPVSAGGGQRASATHVDHRRHRTRASTARAPLRHRRNGLRLLRTTHHRWSAPPHPLSLYLSLL